METKHLLSLIVMVTVVPAMVLMATVSYRLRELMFFALVAGGVIVIDVNFFGEYWYRGTSRGLEVSLADLLAWAVLIGTLVMPRYPGPRWIRPAGLWLMVLYLLYCCYSLSFAAQPVWGVWEVGKVLRGAIILLTAASFVRTRRELVLLVVGLGCSICIEAMYALKQRFLGGIYRVPGTLDHENSLSMYVCTVGPVMMAAALADWSKWLRAFCGLCAALGGLISVLTLSRAGMPIYGLMVAGVALACTSLEITRRKVLIVCGVTALFGAVLLKSWDLILQRYESASLSEEYLDDSGEGRGVYWRWAFLIVEDHPLGIGMNNWSHAVSKTYGAKLGFTYEDYDDIKVSPEKADLPSINYAAPAHSLAALTLGELGYPGLFLFSLVWLRWFQVGVTFLWRRLNPDPMRRLGIGCLFACGGIFLQSTTEWTYRQQPNMFVCHLIMGAMGALYYLRKHAPAPAPEPDVELIEDEIEIAAPPMPAASRTR